MTSTAHALVAGAIAAHVSNPAEAIGLALVSHYVMDSIPHWDFGTNWRNRPKKYTGVYAIGETLFGIGLSYAVYAPLMPFPHWAYTVVAALLPDWLETPWYIVYARANKHQPGPSAGIPEKVAYAFYKIPNSFHSKAQLPLGMITQIVTVGFFIALLG